MPTDSPTDEHGLPRRSRLLRVFLGLLVTAALLAFLLRYVDSRELGNMLLHMDWSWALLAFGLYAVMYVLRAVRFRLVTPQTTFARLLCIACLHNFFVRILPLHAGELSFPVLARKYADVSFGQGLVSLVLLRILDATLVVLLFSAALAFNQDTYLGHVSVGIAVALALAGAGVVAVVWFSPLMKLGLRILRRIVRLFGSPAWSTRFVTRFEESVTSQVELHQRIIAPAAGITALIWLLGYGTMYCMMNAFGVATSVPQAVLGGTAAVVTGFLPISGIGSFGTLDAGWSLGFALVGIEPAIAIASGIGYSVTTFGFTLVLGFSGWLGLRLLTRNRHPVIHPVTGDPGDDKN